MSTKEKLVARFKSLPKDFTFDELVRLLNGLGFVLSNKGKTSGSRISFKNEVLKINMVLHKPHTQGTPIKEASLREIYSYLLNNNIIEK